MTAYLKALIGSVIAGLGSLYQALDNGTVTAQEWTAVALATLAALGVIYGVPNLDPRGQRQEQSVQPPDHDELGYGMLEFLVAVVVVVILVVLLLRLV